MNKKYIIKSIIFFNKIFMQSIFKILEKLQIPYENYTHNPVYSCDEAKCVEIPGKRVKSLLLENKKSSNFYMVVIPDYKKLEVNKVRHFYNDSKLSFVSSEKMQELISLTPGNVSPYALINNSLKNIKVIIDKELENEKIWFHPLRNDNTVVTTMKDVERFLDFLWYNFHYITL